MKRALWLSMGLLWVSLSSCAHHATRDAGEIAASRVQSSRQRGPLSCRPLGRKERAAVLSVASPANYPSTRYRRGPASTRIERETDCSRFVHEVYRRAGLPYDFRATDDLSNAREFDILPECEALPGDLMLFRGHVGIVDEKGMIISATVTRHRHRKSSITRLARKNFRSFRGQRYVLRYRCAPAAEKTAYRDGR